MGVGGGGGGGRLGEQEKKIETLQNGMNKYTKWDTWGGHTDGWLW